MNLKQATIKLNTSEELITKASIELFGVVPKSFDASHIEKLNNHLNTKSLPSTSELRQSNGQIDKNCDRRSAAAVCSASYVGESNLSNQDLAKLIQAANLKGRRLGKLLTDAEDIGFSQEVENGKANMVNRYLNGSIEESIRILKSNESLNQIDHETERTQIIDVTASVQQQKAKVLPPSYDEVKKMLLAPSEEAIRKLLDS